MLEGHDHLFDRFRRASALELLAYDEFVRSGESAHAREAVAALRALAEETSDNPAFARVYARKAEILDKLASGRVPTITNKELEYAYPVAAALLGMGATARNAKWLRASATLFEALGGDVDALHEERGMARGWLVHVAGDGPRPPLPFD